MERMADELLQKLEKWSRLQPIGAAHISSDYQSKKKAWVIGSVTLSECWEGTWLLLKPSKILDIDR